jgi:hypothetical protein
VTTAEVIDRLRGLHPSPEWVAYRECWRIDFFAMRCWPSGVGHRRVACEVKVSRSDFQNDERRPWKHDNARALAHQFFYVCPAEMLAADEVPEWAGLMWVLPRRRPTVVKEAPLADEVRAFTDREVVYLARFALYREGIEADRLELRLLRRQVARLREARYGSGSTEQPGRVVA